MLNHKHRLFITVVFLSLFWQGTIMITQADDTNHPKSRNELKELIKKKLSAFDNSFPFIITRDTSLYLETKNVFPSNAWKQESLSFGCNFEFT